MGGGGTVPSPKVERFEGRPSWAGLRAVFVERFDSELTKRSTFASPTYWTLRPSAVELSVRGTNPRTLAGADTLMGLTRPCPGESWEAIAH